MADPGVEFAFDVTAFGFPVARWGYRFSPAEGGTGYWVDKRDRGATVVRRSPAPPDHPGETQLPGHFSGHAGPQVPFAKPDPDLFVAAAARVGTEIRTAAQADEWQVASLTLG